MNAVVLNSNSASDINLIVELAKKLKIGIMPLTEEELEDYEDMKMGQRIEAALAEGLADRDEVDAYLGLR